MSRFCKVLDLLDMEGVRGSNPRASTTTFSHDITSLQREMGSLFYSFDLIPFAHCSYRAFALSGTKRGQNLVTGFNGVWGDPTESFMQGGHPNRRSKRLPFYRTFREEVKSKITTGRVEGNRGRAIRNY